MNTDLIEKLWGEGSIHGFVGCKPVNGQFTQQAVSSSQDARNLISTLATRGDVYYSPATFRTGQSRQANNVLSLQAFFMDIDCGADKAYKGTGYPNKSAAKEALVEFCSVTGIPTPTEIVDSGNGLHCYWPLDRDIPVETWTTHAKHLKQLATYHGLLADKSVTADPARMLRVPGTLNLKDPQHPKPVALKRSGGSFSTDEFLAHIEQAHKKISATNDRAQIDIPSGNTQVIDAIIAAVAHNHHALWQGEWERIETELGVTGYSSQSEADFSLLGSIGRQAIKTGISQSQLPLVIAEVFTQSQLYRPEKFERLKNHDIPNICVRLIEELAQSTVSTPQLSPESWLSLKDGIIEISDEPPKPRDFVIQDLLVAAKSAVLAGQGGVAKSQLVLQFGVAVALGLPIFGFGTKEGSVILLMGEEDSDEVYRRINAIAKVMRLTSEQKALLKQRLRVFPLVGADIRLTRSINMAIESTGLSDEIVKAAEQLEQESGLSVRLIGLDHAGLVHGGEFNTREDVVQTMRQVNYIAKSTYAAVLVLAHSPKSTAKSEWSTSQDVAGSAAWVDLSRAAFVLRAMSEAEGKQLSISTEDRKGYVSLTTVKGNYISTGDHIWLAKNKVEGYEVSYLTHTKLTATGQPKVGGNRKLRASILELTGQKDLTKTGIERYSGKSGNLRASKGAIKAEVDAMLQDGDLILVQPTEEQRRLLGIRGSTSGFLKPTKGS